MQPHLNQSQAIAVYIHWPYCLVKCPYCDFNSHVRKDHNAKEWGNAILREMASMAEVIGSRHMVSMFFGGGTPSLMPAEEAARIIEMAKSLWPSPSDPAEITLEANPTSVEMTRFKSYLSAGVNRLSMGVQALDDQSLKSLGRTHSVKEALKAWEVANSIFDNTSFDLIYGRVDQTSEQWKQELKQALSLAQRHMSLYQLTFEPGTIFYTRLKQGRMTPLANDTAAEMFEHTQSETEKAGLCSYEISNHAQAGFDCQHNLHVWKYGDYLGLGPGAHSRVTYPDGAKIAQRNKRSPDSWYHAMMHDQEFTDERQILNPQEQEKEQVIMGLRLDQGLDISALSILKRDHIAILVEEGLLALTHNQLAVTADGKLKLDSIIRYII